jgi:peptide/nickel transport system substrate-binding protein
MLMVKLIRAAALALTAAFGAEGAAADAPGLTATAPAAHGIAMHGAPALPPGFAHLPYADPAAPKGGAIAFGAVGGFDSLNPWIVKGRAPPEIRAHTVESLMGRSWDEPFALYGLLASSIETPPDRSWVAFTLRPEARFSDGARVTAADVLWSMETNAAKGRPGFRAVWSKVASATIEAPDRIRFTFSEVDREAPMILGLAPVFSKAQWEGRDFAEPSLDPVIGSGPYVVDAFEAGRFLSLKRDPDYWGRDLPINRGRHNLDEIRVEYFRDAQAQFEAFKAGAITFFRDGDPERWATGYDFAAAREGRITRAEIPHGRPTGMYGFVFNTRRPLFADRRVREALTAAFDFEWVNATLLGGAYRRIEGYFFNSPLGHDGAAAGVERAILEPHAAALPPGALEGRYAPPTSDGDGRNRRNLRKAAQLLEEAGWTVRDGALRDAAGAPFAFEILLESAGDERIAGVFRDALATLGVAATVRTVDSAQYEARRADYDFDMIVNRWGVSLSPGNEQRLYWGRAGVTAPGTRNYMGVDSPAVEAAIDALLAAEAEDDFVAAARALDRALSWGVFVVPFWFEPVSRIAHEARLRRPETLPIYGDWIGWAPEVWWSAAP